jgi:F-type H+-transporting ATPase subunit delta
MINTKLARRYAKSLFDLAEEKKVSDAVFADMELVRSVSAASRDFRKLMQNPTVNTDKKLAVLKLVFAGKVNDITLSYFDILTRKRREEFISEIAVSFISLYQAKKGITVAKLFTAVPAGEELKKKITEIVHHDTGRKIELEETVDASLIGGFILSVGDRQFDESVARKLRTLHREFETNPFVKR